MVRARPPLHFIPADFNPVVLQLAKWVLPGFRNWQLGIREVQGENLGELAKLYQQFAADELRLLLAFRHPNPTDPVCLATLMWQLLPQTAKRQGLALPHPTHFHFIYDRGIPLWLGQGTGWFFSKLGGTSIRRGQVDWTGLRAARQLFVDGRFPMVAAPEGATNGHNEIVSPLEPGVAQLGFWCLEDLYQAGRSPSVAIVPLGIQYEFIEPPWDAIDRTLAELERECGLEAITAAELANSDAPETSLYPRLYRLGGYLLGAMERFYADVYGRSLPPHGEMPQSNEELSQRLNALLDAALTVSESHLDLRPKGSTIDRCRRVEQAGWERIYREDVTGHLSPVERGLADRAALEGDLAMWHMRLVEHFVAVTGSYVRDKPTAERFADTVALLRETFCSILDRPSKRPRLGDRRARVTVAEPLWVDDRWDLYQSGRRGARQAVAELTQDLQKALEATVR